MRVEVFQAFHRDFIKSDDADWIRKISVGGFRSSGLEAVSGDNIEHLNPFYCEITTLYYMWKNSSADIQGLYHYRRYLNFIVEKKWNWRGQKTIRHKPKNIKFLSSPAQKEKIIESMRLFDVVLPLPEFMDPNVKQQFVNACNQEIWDIFLNSLKDVKPEFVPHLKLFELNSYASMCNLFVAKRDFVDSYCKDLFPLLDHLWQKNKDRFSSTFLNRYPGLLAERFLGLWLHVKRPKILYVPMAVISERKPWYLFDRPHRNCDLT